MSVHTDPTVHLMCSDELVATIRRCCPPDKEDTPLGVTRLLKSDQEDSQTSPPLLTVAELQWLSSVVPVPLGSLLLGCRMCLPSPVPTPRSQELEARCIKLRSEQEHREYVSITSNVRQAQGGEHPREGVGAQLREVQGFMLLIVQFVVSVICSFLFGYLSPYYILGRQELGFRLLCGIIAGFVVGCADMYFVIRHMLEEDGIRLVKKTD